MSELRHDPIQKRWVIIAVERARRPSDYTVKEEASKSNFCPFDEGNEDKTPPEIFALRENGSEKDKPGWVVRVIPNKYPALMIEGEIGRRGKGLYDGMNGIGAHEVIVETIDHNLNIPDMPVEHLEKVIGVYKARLKDLMRDPRFRYVLIFKNYGKTAGASLAHPHTQLIATPVTPKTVALELDSAQEHYGRKERCLFCDIIRQEVDAGERIIGLNDQYVAIAPYASRFPFEIFIAPREHCHDFSQAPAEDIRPLAVMLKDVLSRLRTSLNDPPYNFVFHTSPNTEMKPKRPHYWQTVQYDFHWHIEVIPRLTLIAGFEWGTGFYINPTPPEVAAKYLREVKI